MRERYFLPKIAAHNYDTFCGLIGSDLPNTYNEWLQLQAKETRERTQVGYDVQMIEIDPNEFARYCGAKGVATDTLRLVHLACEKAAGHRY